MQHRFCATNHNIICDREIRRMSIANVLYEEELRDFIMSASLNVFCRLFVQINRLQRTNLSSNAQCLWSKRRTQLFKCTMRFWHVAIAFRRVDDRRNQTCAALSFAHRDQNGRKEFPLLRLAQPEMMIWRVGTPFAVALASDSLKNYVQARQM